MLTKHEDKMMPPTGVKFSPAQQRAFDLRMVNLELTAEEQHEVGKAIALANEQRAKDADPFGRELDAAGAPTEEQQKALAEAEAAWRAAKDRTTTARIAAIKQERVVREEMGSQNVDRRRGSSPDLGPTAKQIALGVAAQELRRLEVEESAAADVVVRLRVKIERHREHVRYRMMAKRAGIG